MDKNCPYDREYARSYGANHLKIFTLEAELYVFEVPYIMHIMYRDISKIHSNSMAWYYEIRYIHLEKLK